MFTPLEEATRRAFIQMELRKESIDREASVEKAVEETGKGTSAFFGGPL